MGLTPSALAPLQRFWPAVLMAISIAEVSTVFAFESPFDGERWTIKSDHVPGDLGFDPLRLRPESPEEFKVMQTKELQNGRLAMIAAAGFLAQEAVTDQTWGTYWGLPDF